MRGLKQFMRIVAQINKESHLLQMRGLKPFEVLRRMGDIFVASFTDAWIETRRFSPDMFSSLSHLLQMRGLKLFTTKDLSKQMTSHLLQMRGLKLRFALPTKKDKEVASFTDAWIETYLDG